MDIKQFKEMLFKGEVKFVYTKSDGSTRTARGTLCESLTPKDEATRKFKLTDIEWVKTNLFSDGDKLPTSMTIKIAESFIADHSADAPMYNIIENALLEQFNRLVDDFKFEEVQPKKLAEGTIFYYDLDKGGYRSFKADRLIEVL